MRMIDESATDLRDPIDRTKRIPSGATEGMAATVEEGKTADHGTVCKHASRDSVSSESTIRSGGSPGTKQIETSFCGTRPIGSISSFDNVEREAISTVGTLSTSFEGATKINPVSEPTVSCFTINAIVCSIWC